MDGSRPGEAGVLAWCNTIRFNMAQDPGRQILHDQIQTQGFDFLDSYLENFFEGPKNECVCSNTAHAFAPTVDLRPVIELLKTPGRKKNAPARTRAGTAAAEKARAVTSLSFEDSDLKENQEPVNEFQRALLRAKEKADEESARQTVPAQQTTVERPLKQHPFFAKLKSQKIVTIADSPVADTPGRSIHAMDLDRDAEPIPAVVFDREPGLMDHATTSSQQVDAHPHESCESIKELSMIAEDDEPAERSRVSFKTATSPNSLARSPPVETARSSPVQETFHDAPRGPEPLASETAQTEVPEDAYSARVSEPSAEDLTTASANTFHSIPLDSPRNRELNPPGFRADDSHTAPLPKLSLPPVPLEEDPHAHTAPLPSSSSLHEEYTVPLREEPSVPVPGLSRKTSVSQFSGLPAPSPLRKSLRVPGDPAVANPAGTAGLPGGKRTSWLSKARETKAMESTVKRSNTLTHGLGFGALTANKRKSGEMLDSGKDLPAIPNATLKPVDEEQRVAKHPKLAGASADDNFDVNSEAKAASPEVDMGVGPQAENDAPAKTVNHAASPAIGDAMNREEDGLLGLFKKPIDSAARMTKGAGKSLGGNAAAALAEARARAEARVAERHKLELGLMTDSEDVSMTAEEKPESTDGLPAQPEESERRLSLSDLVSASHDDKGKGPVITRQSTQILDADTSTSTTPPHSPPPQSRNTSFVAPSGPVFTKPPAPFGPRPPTSTRLDPAAPSMGRDFSFKLASNPFSIPAAMTLGMGSNKIVPLSAQSSKGSVFSDIVFDTKNASPQPAWMPSTQDTSYSAGGSQSQHASKFGNPAEADNDDLDDDDDSWGVDEKFAAHQTWTPFGFSTGDPGTGDEQIMKDDTMTWTTYPSHSTSTSQRGGDTGPADEDNTKKREIPTKTASKPPSKDKKDSAVPRTVKPPPVPAAASSSKTSTIPKSALKQPAAPTVPATPGGSKSTTTGKTLKSAPSSSNLRSTAGTSKGKGPTTEPSEQPPTAKGKMAPPATRSGPPAEPPVVASEDIELPDINSEYSDSEDEDRPRRELPDWAQSPDIAAALQQQSTINPDDIFGRIGPLRMEEIFRTRQSRFRARTSSANWTGTDELTAEEEREYARRMGFR
ncbi:hypothetical protein BN946_scf184911.g1 [Trametes cinnabarina]|uniref:Inner centromere protein ARK-binding domain-containing protein n=1 Tax=Pycnoporus cinnabarinus TaxID=5643 RepID=A0A060SBC3_PYCCI|nr:hypothetical protein BN946_scf184911.g1 [Trametes cinnabarina]